MQGLAGQINCIYFWLTLGAKDGYLDYIHLRHPLSPSLVITGHTICFVFQKAQTLIVGQIKELNETLLWTIYHH